MASTFLQHMGRTHYTKPMINARNTDEANIQLYGGVGVRTGFHTATDPGGNSREVSISRGITVGPNGELLTTGLDFTHTPNQARQAVVGDTALVNVADLLDVNLTGDYDSIDPTAHSILVTIDALTHELRAHKITAAEVITITGEITDLGGVSAFTIFDSSTGIRRARANVSRKDPDDLNGAAALAAAEYVIAIVDKDVSGAGGVIDSVTLLRERDVYANLSGLTG